MKRNAIIVASWIALLLLWKFIVLNFQFQKDGKEVSGESMKAMDSEMYNNISNSKNKSFKNF